MTYSGAETSSMTHLNRNAFLLLACVSSSSDEENIWKAITPYKFLLLGNSSRELQLTTGTPADCARKLRTYEFAH